MNRLLISAAHKSSGKTTLTLGLCAALRARGLAVQPFKKARTISTPCGSRLLPAVTATISISTLWAGTKSCAPLAPTRPART